MATNPYPKLPRDVGQEPMQEYPAATSVLAMYASENVSVSSVINVTHDTTIIEIAAVGGPAVMRWVSSVVAFGAASSVISAAGTANFNHVIPAATVRRFAIPIERFDTNPASVQGANRMNGLYNRVAIKSIGIASVLLTEY